MGREITECNMSNECKENGSTNLQPFEHDSLVERTRVSNRYALGGYRRVVVL